MKKQFLFLPFLLLLTLSVFGQKNGTGKSGAQDVIVRKNNAAEKDSSKVYDIVNIETMPTYPGGDDALVGFISKHVKYPRKSRRANIQGKVTVAFVVDKDGSVTDVHVKKGIEGDDDRCNNEAVRVVSMLKKFTPGIQNGRLVKVAFSIPITFRIQN